MTLYYIGQTLSPDQFPADGEPVCRGDLTVDRKWFVVQTNPRCEAKAAERVKKAGFQAYAPVKTFWGKRDRRQKIPRREGPLMPGYLFVELPERGAFDHVRRCDGVVHVVETCGDPAVIPQVWIDDMMARERRGEFDSTKGKPLGRIVRIIDGPFRSFNAKVLADGHADERIRVEVMLFGRLSPVELSIAQVEELC